MHRLSLISISAVMLGLLGCSDQGVEVSKDSIVSTTLCADTYLLALPDSEERLAALSWQSSSSLSRAPAHLRNLPQTDDDLERNRKWANATIVSSAGGRGDIDLKWGEDFETVWTNLETLSTSLELPNPSEKYKARLRNIESAKKQLRVLYLDRSGATAGPGTFVDAVFQTVGASNVIEKSGWQSPDTETLLGLNPDVIVTSFMGSNYVGVNDRALRHDALAAKIKEFPHINVPGGLWPCAGPGLVEAAELLSKELAAL